MSYNRLHGDSLRFYIDSINWLISRGVARTEWEDKNTGAWDYNTGVYDNKYSLIDMNPMRQATFDESGTEAHIMHQMDMVVSAANPINFLAVMNHNGGDAAMGFRIAYNSSAFTNPGDGTTIVNPVAVLNGSVNPLATTTTEDISIGETLWDVDDGGAVSVGELLLVGSEVIKVTSISVNTLTVARAQQGTSEATYLTNALIRRYGVIVPDDDGDTILTFDQVTSGHRYWCIETIPIQTGSAGYQADPEVGAYVVGNYHDIAVAPDLDVRTGFLQEGVNIRRTPSGKELAFAHSLSANDGTGKYAPFRYNAVYQRRPTGRQTFNMKWQGMPDTNIYPEDLANIVNGGDLYSDVIRKLSINYLPFILSLDSDGDLAGDHNFVRLDQESFEAIQKAWQWNGIPSIRAYQLY